MSPAHTHDVHRGDFAQSAYHGAATGRTNSQAPTVVAVDPGLEPGSVVWMGGLPIGVVASSNRPCLKKWSHRYPLAQRAHADKLLRSHGFSKGIDAEGYTRDLMLISEARVIADKARALGIAARSVTTLGRPVAVHFTGAVE